MNKQSGLILSEVMTLIICVAVVSGISFGFYVSSERDSRVARAVESVAAVGLAVDEAVKAGAPIRCSNDLVEESMLSNDYLTLTVQPMAFDPTDRTEGYGAGVFVASSREEDGNTTFVSAQRLYQSLEELERYQVRLSMQSEDNIAYGVLVSDEARCGSTLVELVGQ